MEPLRATTRTCDVRMRACPVRSGLTWLPGFIAACGSLSDRDCLSNSSLIKFNTGTGQGMDGLKLPLHPA